MHVSVSTTCNQARRYQWLGPVFCQSPVFFWRQLHHHFRSLSFQRLKTFCVEVSVTLSAKLRSPAWTMLQSERAVLAIGGGVCVAHFRPAIGIAPATSAVLPPESPQTLLQKMSLPSPQCIAVLLLWLAEVAFSSIRVRFMNLLLLRIAPCLGCCITST